MALRHIVFAACMASACAAHADVISSASTSTSAQSAFLSGWTTSNGASVIGSGAMSGNLSLVGGVAYGSSADQAGSLMSQASSTIASGGQTKLFYSKGIEGMYLLGAGHGILAAMLGNSVSVVGSNGGVIVGTGSVADVGAANVMATGGGKGGMADTAHTSQLVRAQASAVPEPSTAALMLIGLVGAGALTRRRTR